MQKISSYRVIFYDIDDKEIDIPEFYLTEAYTELDQAIYEWECEKDVVE